MNEFFFNLTVLYLLVRVVVVTVVLVVVLPVAKIPTNIAARPIKSSAIIGINIIKKRFVQAEQN